MSTLGRSKRTVGIGLAGAVMLAVGAWIAGEQVRSPAQIAAETAAPTPSAITAPVEKRVLQSEVIVRGTVRYGSPQPVVLVLGGLRQRLRSRCEEQREHEAHASNPADWSHLTTSQK
jgi:hypothetical protein